jgi:hypothetical protein
VAIHSLGSLCHNGQLSEATVQSTYNLYRSRRVDRIMKQDLLTDSIEQKWRPEAYCRGALEHRCPYNDAPCQHVTRITDNA